MAQYWALLHDGLEVRRGAGHSDLEWLKGWIDAGNCNSDSADMIEIVKVVATKQKTPRVRREWLEWEND